MSKRIVNAKSAPAAIGPYSQANIVGNMLYISGQLPMLQNGELVSGDIKKETRQCLENIKAIIEEAGCSLDDVVKATVYVTNLGDFAEINEVYAEFFKTEPPARACIQVTALPKGARVEIDAIAALRD